MKKEYLSEAFKQLELLNEEDFNLSTTADNSDLKDFLDNDDMSVMSLDVIDPEAESEEDLEDSYTGKVILDCCVCHSKLYKDKEEVQIDEEQDLANVGEECPFCYSNDGFKIIGEVAPYGETKVESEVGEEPKDIEHERDDNDDFEESLKPDKNNSLQNVKKAIKLRKTNSVSESIKRGLQLKEGYMGQTLEDFLDDWNTKSNVTIWCYDENEDGPVFEGDISDIPDKYLNAQFDDFDTEGKIFVNVSGVDDDFEESLKGSKDKLVSESIQEIEIETDTDKIKIESEPKEEASRSEDVLAPVSPETEQEIENNGSDEVDVPIDEFDEETFDELGESFLKNTYENVESYKTESIKEQDGNKLVVEGLITFNSGKVKKTSFIFEAKDITKSGKVRFIGENCQLSRGKKSFTVAGKVQEGKFISESLNYNYRAKDAKSGKSTRMYGTVRTSN